MTEPDYTHLLSQARAHGLQRHPFGQQLIDALETALVLKAATEAANGMLVHMRKGEPFPDREAAQAAVQAFLDRKYTLHATPRQQEMGIAYITAEHQDLAREVTRLFMQMLGARG